MKRERTELPITQIIDNIDVNIILCVDSKNMTKIINIITENHEAFKKCFVVMNSGSYINELYRREYINAQAKAKGITAIKMKVGANYRIYCQEEIENGVKRITMCRSHKKTSQKNDKKTTQIIKTVSKYNYN